jgi:arylsulfatase A-like enzyme
MPDTRRWFGLNGTIYPNAFATTPVCCPARASIMTGRYAHNHEVKRNNAEDVARLDHETTLQHYLQMNGFYTGIYGKFLNKWHDDPPFFDRWSTFRGKHDYYGGQWNVDGEQTEIPGYRTTTLEDHIGSFLADAERVDEDPWFLYVAVEAPHDRYIPEPQYEHSLVPPWRGNPAMRERNLKDKPSYVWASPSEGGKGRRIRRRQLQTLRSVDDLVDDLFLQLGALEERRNTLAVYVSDNGYSWGEHGLTGAVRGKGNPYSPSIRVPLLVRWPKKVKRPQVDDRLVANVDIAPTILDVTQVGPGDGPPFDGRSLLERWDRREMLLEHWHNELEDDTFPTWRSVRTRRWQYTEYTSDGVPYFREYYDLIEDPWELHNLLADRRKSNDPDVRRLHLRLSRLATCHGSTCP